MLAVIISSIDSFGLHIINYKLLTTQYLVNFKILRLTY